MAFIHSYAHKTALKGPQHEITVYKLHETYEENRRWILRLLYVNSSKNPACLSLNRNLQLTDLFPLQMRLLDKKCLDANSFPLHQRRFHRRASFSYESNEEFISLCYINHPEHPRVRQRGKREGSERKKSFQKTISC